MIDFQKLGEDMEFDRLAKASVENTPPAPPVHLSNDIASTKKGCVTANRDAVKFYEEADRL